MNKFVYIKHLLRDIFIIASSIFFAYLLTQGGYLDSFFASGKAHPVIASVLAGAFFTSVFTIAPSSIALIALSKTHDHVFIAFLGAIGATIVDLTIASFVRKEISHDLSTLGKLHIRRHFLKAFHFGFLKWVAFIVGMFLIVSPFPDEFGLFLVGLSRVKPSFLPFIFFIAHFFGIFALIQIIN